MMAIPGGMGTAVGVVCEAPHREADEACPGPIRYGFLRPRSGLAMKMDAGSL